MWGYYVGIALAAFAGVGWLIYYLITMTKKANRDQKEIRETIPKIKEGAEKAKNELAKNSFVQTEHYSSLGYKFTDYRTKFHMPDNLNFDIDAVHKRFACYLLVPYGMRIYNYADLRSVELMINNGKVETSSISSGMATGIGGVGVGLGATSGTAQQQVTAMIVLINFRDGNQHFINFLDNIPTYQGSDRYNVAVTSAKNLISKLEIIIEENTPKDKKDTVNNADELVKYKKLLDDGVITEQEFNEKKKQLLGL